jgi:hypothetical protein
MSITAETHGFIGLGSNQANIRRNQDHFKWELEVESRSPAQRLGHPGIFTNGTVDVVIVGT